jgi:small subunit ribosomal protein S8
MSLSDPIADMLTRVRNALMASLPVVEMPHSRLKGEIARVLKKEGYVSDFSVEGSQQKTLKVYLKYGQDGKPVIQGLRRESRPGLRRYVPAREIPRVLGGLGISVLSTPAGVLSGHDARRQNVGGEIICSVW